MKKSIYPLTLVTTLGAVFAPSLLASTVPPGGSAVRSHEISTCQNDRSTKCTSPCGETYYLINNKKDPAPECSDVCSRVENGSLRYAMWARDYSFSNFLNGCSPCGGSASNANILPFLDLTHNTYISVIEVFPSFGDRSGFAKYDDVVIFAKNVNTIFI